MRKEAFSGLLQSLIRLTPGQRKGLLERLQAMEAEPGTREGVERVLGEVPACPSCGATRICRWGHMSGLQRFRCGVCGRSFNRLSGTPLAGLRHKARWMEYAACLEQGMTVRASAKACDIHKDTAFRWRHRFLERISEDQAEDLEGIVEADETLFRESLKGHRHLPRPARKRGTPASQRGRCKQWINAVTIRDRAGDTRELVLKDFNRSALVEDLAFVLRPDVILCTDGSSVYRSFAQAMALTHEPVTLSAGVRVRQSFHIQNVNAYHSRLKTWIQRFHGVGTYYLPNYLGWHRLLDGHAATLTPAKLIRVALGLDHYQRTTQT